MDKELIVADATSFIKARASPPNSNQRVTPFRLQSFYKIKYETARAKNRALKDDETTFGDDVSFP